MAAADPACADLPPLIQGLLHPEAYPHPVGRIRLLQTHISWILLTGATAYKIKKPVDFGFVNFTSLGLRRHFCHEELRLNRRLSPSLYLDVVGIGGSPARPCLRASPDPDPDPDPGAGEAGRQPTGADAVLEYAVRMVEFPQDALLPAALARGAVRRCHIEALADRLARFHSGAEPADPGGSYGTAAAVLEPVEANITSLRLHGDPGLGPRLDRLQDWITATHRQLRNRFGERLAAGRIRECHGDLHLGNLLLRHDAIEVFDCLEFNASLRWIDPISDLAFLVMDLEQQGQPALASLLLNRWLEQCADHQGLELWHWYKSYRAMVRAKVAALGGQPESVDRYVRLAETTAQPAPQGLVLCHGVSGSGKSHSSSLLLEQLGAIRLRSDVERKRLFAAWGVEPGGKVQGAAATPPQLQGELYDPAVTRQLFGEVLPGQASTLLQAGFTVIVDATFLRHEHRQTMAAVAGAVGVPLVILSFSAPQPVLEQRLQLRQARGTDPSDADLAVLRRQWQSQEPLTAEEQTLSLAISCDPSAPESQPSPLELVELVRRRLRPRPPGIGA